jgi:hypothetical protein
MIHFTNFSDGVCTSSWPNNVLYNQLNVSTPPAFSSARISEMYCATSGLILWTRSSFVWLLSHAGRTAQKTGTELEADRLGSPHCWQYEVMEKDSRTNCRPGFNTVQLMVVTSSLVFFCGNYGNLTIFDEIWKLSCWNTSIYAKLTAIEAGLGAYLMNMSHSDSKSCRSRLTGSWKAIKVR